VRMLHLVFGVGLVLFASGGGARAQTPQDQKTGAIAGTVQDNTAAVMPGVSVTITNASGATQTVVADEKGEFTATGLPPGAYTVSAKLQGFKDFRATGIIVAAGETARVNIILEPAGVTEKVSVEGNAVTQVEQQSSQIFGTITSKELTSLMLNGRNFTQLIALTPGVSNQTGQDEALVGVKGSVKYSVNGGRVEYNSYEIDGGDILNASLNGSSSTLIVYPSIDAIGSLQVLTSNFGAMYGRSASGITVASTKSGADFSGFHGGGYFFLRNEHMNARNFFDQTKHAPLYQKYDPGGTLGGPRSIKSTIQAVRSAARCIFQECLTPKRTKHFSLFQRNTATSGSRWPSIKRCRPWPSGPEFSRMCVPQRLRGRRLVRVSASFGLSMRQWQLAAPTFQIAPGS